MKGLTKQLILIYLSLLWGTALGQNKISGTVTDAETGETIVGATVIIQGTSQGTVTDIEGKYNLSVPDDAIITVKFVGFKEQNITVGTRSIIDVPLLLDVAELEEVVVIGYGTQKKKVVTGAIASVGAKQIEKLPIVRAEQALQGFAAGVQVTNFSGQPGESPTITIRGAGSTGDATPLFVVDGFLVENIDFLNPADIESIDVLKDASTAAIYGASAANGVVLITTKSGQDGKLNISYDGYFGIQNAPNHLDVLNADQYKMIFNEMRVNAGGQPFFDLNEVSEIDTDWQSEVFEKNAPIMSHNLTINGGNEKVNRIIHLSMTEYWV